MKLTPTERKSLDAAAWRAQYGYSATTDATRELASLAAERGAERVCPECDSPDFDVRQDFGLVEDLGVAGGARYGAWDTFACRNCGARGSLEDYDCRANPAQEALDIAGLFRSSLTRYTQPPHGRAVTAAHVEALVSIAEELAEELASERLQRQLAESIIAARTPRAA